jgi:hypothetical protein
MKRFVELDYLRGGLLLMMIVDHSPSWLRRFTDQPLGFFSTAECFVFVSAFLAGKLFRKRTEKLGFAAARSATIRRAWRIYGAHVATLAFTFVLGSFFLFEFPGIANLLDHYLRDPWAAICSSLTLLFRPPLMDILPMYILFSLLTPAVFWMARRWGWSKVLLLSLVAWMVAQAHVRDALSATASQWPFIELGPFDLLAWQLLWLGGLFTGQRFLGDAPLVPRHGSLRAILLLCAIAFLVWRWTPSPPGAMALTRTWLFDKWHLGPLRLLNFAITGTVTATFLKSLNRWEPLLRPLSLIGRHMLAVFSIEICLSVLLIGRTESGLAGEPVITALVLCQLLTAPLLAWFLEWRLATAQSAHSRLGTQVHIPNATPGTRAGSLPSKEGSQQLIAAKAAV